MVPEIKIQTSRHPHSNIGELIHSVHLGTANFHFLAFYQNIIAARDCSRRCIDGKFSKLPSIRNYTSLIIHSCWRFRDENDEIALNQILCMRVEKLTMIERILLLVFNQDLCYSSVTARIELNLQHSTCVTILHLSHKNSAVVHDVKRDVGNNAPNDTINSSRLSYSFSRLIFSFCLRAILRISFV